MTNRKLKLAAVMMFEAATLAIASTLHLSGTPASGSKPYTPSGAGIAEAIICTVLLVGAGALVRSPRRGRAAAVAATAFAIAGFVIGLTFTLRGGTTGDVIYHAAMVPMLVATLLTLIGSDTVARRHGATSDPAAG
jgi:peptidoglycan/LPS O-acetylase OafA/YrhL